MKELEKRGDIQEGIIIDRVLDKAGMPEFQVGDVTTTSREEDPKTENIQVHPHCGSCEGLGDFVAKWFKDHPQVNEGAKDIYELKQKLTEMVKESIKPDESNKGVVLRKTLKTLKVSLKAMQESYSYGNISPEGEGEPEGLGYGGRISAGSSGDDSSDAGSARGVITADQILRGVTYMHKAKQAKSIAKTKFHDTSKLDDFKRDFYQMGIKAGILRLETPQNIDRAMDIVLGELQKKDSVTEEEMSTIFRTAEEQANPLRQKNNIESTIRNFSSTILRSTNLLNIMRTSGKYNMETLINYEESLKGMNVHLSKLEEDVKNIQQETDLHKLQDFLAEAKQQREVAEQLYKDISNTPPVSIPNPLPRPDTTLEDAISGTPKRSREELPVNLTREETGPPTPGGPRDPSQRPGKG